MPDLKERLSGIVSIDNVNKTVLQDRIHAILDDHEIKEALDLLKMKKAGTLCVLDDDQELPEVDCTMQDGGDCERDWKWCQEDMKSHRFRRVRAFDDKVCEICGEPSCPGNMVNTGPDPYEVEINDNDADCDLCETCYEDKKGGV